MGWWDRQKRDVAKEIRKTLSEQGILVKIIFAVLLFYLGSVHGSLATQTHWFEAIYFRIKMEYD